MFWCLREVLKGSSVLFFSLRSLTVKHVATEEQSRAERGEDMAAAQVGMSWGEDLGAEGGGC